MAMQEEGWVAGAGRRGRSGAAGPVGGSRRPWLAVWQVLLERALEAERVPAPTRKAWLAVVDAYLGEFRRHPVRIAPGELREWLFRTGELGGSDPSRSLAVAMDALAFFYARVVPSPALTDAARRPFDAPPPAPGDAALFALLRERLVGGGAGACLESPDWRGVLTSGS